MILAVDIGNTNIVVGCIDGERICFVERLSTVSTRTELEYAISFKNILELYGNPDLTGVEVISTMKRLCCLYIDTEVARRYDVQALAPQLIEYGELDGLSVYVWPEKYYN